MKVLITGSRGTIGTPLSKELAKRGHDVYGLDLTHNDDPKCFRADVADYRQLWKVMSKGDYDLVYHLAAEFGRHNGEEYYETLWRTNVIGTRNILEQQKILGFKLIFASSSEIYGESGDVILDEELPNRVPIIQHNDYATSKWVNEVQIMNFEKKYGIEAVRCRFFNAYGEGEKYHDYRSVVCLFCYRALKGIPWEVYEGYNRVFMHITDFIPTLANVADRFKAGEVYNIGGTDYRSVHELSDLILKYTGADTKLVKYLGEDKHNVVSKKPDISKAMRELSHNPKVTLEDGLQMTLKWMKIYYNI